MSEKDNTNRHISTGMIEKEINSCLSINEYATFLSYLIASEQNSVGIIYIKFSIGKYIVK